MHSLKRSTNERVLARHHALSKRLPAAAEPPRHAAAPSDDDDENLDNILGLGNGEVDDPRTVSRVPVRETIPANTVPANTVPARPVATVVTSRVVAPPPNTLPAAATAAPSVPASVPVVPKLPPSSASPSTVSTPSTTPTPSPTPVIAQTANRGVSTSASATVAPETSPSASDTTSSKSSKGISSGAIGGIVAVLVVAVLLVAGFFIRKNNQRRRALKRNTWGAGLVPSLDTKRQTLYGSGAQPGRPVSPYGGVPEHERLANLPPAEMAQTTTPRVLSVPPALATASSAAYGGFPAPGPNPPPAAYNSNPSTPISPFVAPTLPPPSLRSLSVSPSPAPASEVAVVARTFIPSLPDELHISNGEQISILSAYDDGWALCANSRGEQGVVPLECLDRRGGAPTEMQLQPHSGLDEMNRTSRRMSSLAPAAPGTY